jgi:hypothetical protein
LAPNPVSSCRQPIWPRRFLDSKKDRQILPSGLTLSLKLETPIDSTDAMIGDKIRAILDRPVLLPDKSSIPKGAVVEGYIREFEKLDQDRPYCQIGLEFDRIRWPDHSADFFAEASRLIPWSVSTTQNIPSAGRVGAPIK